MKKTIVFTDLDGTLLDESTYSHAEASPALHLILATSTPLVLCSSKTRAEIEVLREQMNTYILSSLKTAAASSSRAAILGLRLRWKRPMATICSVWGRLTEKSGINLSDCVTGFTPRYEVLGI
jgi:ribonucleotide monophosphatase NagD (HAD superfamily)